MASQFEEVDYQCFFFFSLQDAHEQPIPFIPLAEPRPTRAGPPPLDHPTGPPREPTSDRSEDERMMRLESEACLRTTAGANATGDGVVHLNICTYSR